MPWPTGLPCDAVDEISSAFAPQNAIAPSAGNLVAGTCKATHPSPPLHTSVPCRVQPRYESSVTISPPHAHRVDGGERRSRFRQFVGVTPIANRFVVTVKPLEDFNSALEGEEAPFNSTQRLRIRRRTHLASNNRKYRIQIVHASRPEQRVSLVVMITVLVRPSYSLRVATAGCGRRPVIAHLVEREHHRPRGRIGYSPTESTICEASK